MRNYKAVVSDIDGTIAPLEVKAAPSARVKAAIRDMARLHIPFCLATGKPFSLVEHLIEELEITSPIIVDNGGGIFDPSSKQPLWQSVMDHEKIETITEVAKKYNTTIRLSNGRNGKLLEEVKDKKNISKLLVMDLLPEQAAEFMNYITQTYSELTCIRAQSYKGDTYLDVYVTNDEATKQQAVIKLAQILNIATEDMIGIGDHYNDFPMLMACGLKIAMGNAVDDIKAIADYIAPSVDEDGVAHVLQKFVLDKQNPH